MNKWRKIRANKYCLYLNNNLDINLHLGDNVHTLCISTYFNSEDQKEELKTFALKKEININDTLKNATQIAIEVIENKATIYKNGLEECVDLINKLKEVKL